MFQETSHAITSFVSKPNTGRRDYSSCVELLYRTVEETVKERESLFLFSLYCFIGNSSSQFPLSLDCFSGHLVLYLLASVCPFFVFVCVCVRVSCWQFRCVRSVATSRHCVTEKLSHCLLSCTLEFISPLSLLIKRIREE